MKILVTGGTGMVGQAFTRISTLHSLDLVGSKDYNLARPEGAWWMIKNHKPDAIIHLAARVGGVKGNKDYVADFYRDNILINTNVLDAARAHNVPKVVSLLSTCIYPESSTYPLTFDQIHKGPPHPSNFGYAYAKRMLDVHSRALREQYGLDYVTIVPNNIYGPNDNFDYECSHVVPAMIRKIYDAKCFGSTAVFWGSGEPLREFTFSNDVAEILLWAVENYSGPRPLNVGRPGEITVKELARQVAKLLEFDGDIVWDTTKPEGQFRKPSSNVDFINVHGDFSYTTLKTGLSKTIGWFLDNYPNIRGV